MSKDRTDFLWKVIGRFDFYINSTNTKANFLMAFNTFIIGGLSAHFSNLMLVSSSYPLLRNSSLILIILSFVAAIVSLWHTFSVVNPFLKSNKKVGEYHSSIFFQDVAEYESPESFFQKFSKDTDNDLLKDLAYQTHVLSKGATSKFDHLKKALVPILCIQIPALTILLFMRFLDFFIQSFVNSPK